MGTSSSGEVEVEEVVESVDAFEVKEGAVESAEAAEKRRRMDMMVR